jgi:2-polyprenyl-3-methyl-5-hydroxy-6-metoxy-1,4-benzoquinol methylase
MSDRQTAPPQYDQMYLTGDTTYERPLTSPYYPLYRKVLRLCEREETRSVLEVGCGSGVLAEMLIAAGITYAGFDFSAVAIEKARQRNRGGRFFVADATDPHSYDVPYQGIVCCEVLEHVEADLGTIGRWRPGAVCVCSVPNFNYPTHVRLFRSESEVRRRYAGLLDIKSIDRVAKSASANLSWRDYSRRLRWARNDPTRLLGMLGINRFSWYGGWFVFVAQRR